MIVIFNPCEIVLVFHNVNVVHTFDPITYIINASGGDEVGPIVTTWSWSVEKRKLIVENCSNYDLATRCISNNLIYD